MRQTRRANSSQRGRGQGQYKAYPPRPLTNLAYLHMHPGLATNNLTQNTLSSLRKGERERERKPGEPRDRDREGEQSNAQRREGERERGRVRRRPTRLGFALVCHDCSLRIVTVVSPLPRAACCASPSCSPPSPWQASFVLLSSLLRDNDSLV
jgi:hypothetical protein